MLDGEIVIVDAQGRSSFQKLQRATGEVTITGFAYDVLSRRLQPRSESLKHWKELLKNLVGSNSHGVIRCREHINGSGPGFFKHPCEYGIEGIASKLTDSPYESTRNRNWLKVQCSKHQELVIPGYTPSSKAKTRPG